jgi:hypothetical protein
MFDPCPPMPALEFCSSTECSDTKLLLVVEKCKTKECVILSIYLRCSMMGRSSLSLAVGKLTWHRATSSHPPHTC